MTFAQAYAPEPAFLPPDCSLQNSEDFHQDPVIFTVSLPYTSSSPDFTSSSSPEASDVPRQVPVLFASAKGFQVTASKKTRVVRTASGQLRPCSICGDLATGWHYDVLSCNGCKTFFRRTLLQKRKFVCTRGGNCQFTKGKRLRLRVSERSSFVFQISVVPVEPVVSRSVFGPG